MTTEKLLVKTKDNCVVAFDITYQNAAERTRLALECENICKDIIYRGRRNDFTYSSTIDLDERNTEFLNREISGYHCRKDRARFRNGMRNEPPADAPNTLYLPHRMEDDEFPEMIKNIGYEITATDKEYAVHYNSATGQFEALDFKTRMASVNSEARQLEIVRNHFRFSAQDYARLQELKTQYENHRRSNRYMTESEYAENHLSDRRDRALFWFYGQEVERVKHKDSIIVHELKHVKNSVLADGLSLKNENKRLSTENYYRLAVEDERSAYLGQLVHDINKYLQKGDMNDFSMFDDENQEIVNNIKALNSDVARRAYATNWPQLLAEKIRDFETRHRSYYDNGQEDIIPTADDFDNDGDNKLRQFLIDTKYWVKKAPLNAPEDTDGSEFRKYRALYYNYQIYNPQTHRMEFVNLAQYITPGLEVAISPEIQREIIEPQKARLQQRLSQFESDKAHGLIDVNLIDAAKRLMRDSISNREFVTDVDNIRISTLYESDNTNTPSTQPAEPTQPETETPPSRPSVPDDRADWSDGLKNYWSRVEGYSEVAKNNEEYKFKINDATVRYTSNKQVEVSRNADFDLYMKLLKEPSSRSAPVEFLDTLSQNQKLMLYIACVNSGRRMKGAVPTDLSGIEHLEGIPAEEMNRFRHRMETRSEQPPHEQHRSQRQATPLTQKAMLQRQNRGR